MTIIELKGVEYNLPENWGEISVGKFQEVSRFGALMSTYKSEALFALELYAILLDAPLKTLKTITRESFDILSKELTWMDLDITPSDKETLTIGDDLYIPVKDLNKLSMGDTVSIETIISNSNENDMLGNLAPLLFRKAKVKMVDDVPTYEPMEFDYDEYDKIKELFLNEIMVTDVIKYTSFFLNGAK